MRWQGGRESDNVEDRRGMGGGGRMVLGGGMGMILFVVIALVMGVDPQALLQQIGDAGVQVQEPQEGGEPAPTTPEEAEKIQFVKVVLGDTEDVWTKLFAQMGRQYEKPKLVLFSGQVQSACGLASTAVGPFYCPGDQQVYLDLAFFDELTNRFGAPGEFAQAYVIAHEIGHHVQTLLGVSDKVQRLRAELDKVEFNRVSVRMELQADFYAGVWAHHAQEARPILEAGDIEAGLRAASAIGDDRIQKESQGYVVPDAFTHGTSEQRVRWFKKGLQTGDMKQGDTFNTPDERL